MGVATHHLAGWVLGQTAHHAVHLVKLLLGGLHLSVELLVLGVLVVKHSSVLVSLLVGSNRWVFTGDEGKKTMRMISVRKKKGLAGIPGASRNVVGQNNGFRDVS